MYLHPLLSAHVSEQERSALVKQVELRSYRRNEVVIHSEDFTSHVYCVASGLLRITVDGAADTEVTTDFLRQDQFFLGDSWGAGPYRPGATLLAALPSSIYLIPVASLHALCLRYPQIACELLDLQLQRTRMLRQQLRKVTSFPSSQRVGRIMHDLTHLAPSATGGYDKRISQAVIASFTGLSREQVNRIVRDMESRGLISKGEKGVELRADFASTDFRLDELGDPDAAEPAQGPLLDDDAFFGDLEPGAGRRPQK